MKYSSEIDDQWLTNWISQFFLQLDASVKPFAENHLSITIDPQQEGIRFFFDLCGTIEKKEVLQGLVNEASNGVSIQQVEINDEEFSLEVFFHKNI